MGRPVCYDVTRLLTRILNATPNGIDRVDHALATHFFSGDPAATFGATCTGLGARLMRGPAAAEAVAGIAAHWGEGRPATNDDPVYRNVVARLTGRAGDGATRLLRRRAFSPRPVLPRPNVPGIVDWVRRHGLPIASTPRAHLPLGSVYINASQFPLWVAASFEWLEARRDVRAAFFIHDLLPVLLPEYFRAAEYQRHMSRLRNFARFGSAAIVTTKTVAADLEAHLVGLGRRDMPIFVRPTPISPTFSTPRAIDPALTGVPFFVFCSTLEPRKNHLMLLAVWRELVARRGKGAPKLVLVGTRGWHYGPIVDLIGRSPALREHVIEVSGLSTPGLKRLIDNAVAVLMPTFGEGYGLPVHEALAAGAPVVASDVPAFREIGDASGLTLVSPLAGEAWLEAIARLADQPRPERPPARGQADWLSYFAALDAFVAAL